MHVLCTHMEYINKNIYFKNFKDFEKIRNSKFHLKFHTHTHMTFYQIRLGLECSSVEECLPSVHVVLGARTNISKIERKRKY